MIWKNILLQKNKKAPMFLKTCGTKIVDQKGKAIQLRGFNVGGWLMMEAYILGAPNYAEHKFKNEFVKKLGSEALAEFEKAFRSTFIGEEDFKNIKRMGFNCIRVPFNYRILEPQIKGSETGAIKYLDQAVDWAEKYGLWVILDLHAAPGSQNHDWHADSDGKAGLWTSPAHQKHVCKIWEFLADRYKDRPGVAGYDLLNETVMDDTKLLNKFYKDVIKVIRCVDRNHILFIEGNKWSTDITFMDDYEDDNYAISIHSYEPLKFTFNLEPLLKYPLKTKEYQCNRSTLKKHLEQYAKISNQRQRPIYNGEFGVNARQGLYGEDIWLKDMIELMAQFDFHWTYWTYKAVKSSIFPDGLYSYVPNPPWVNRIGPRFGWDTFADLWAKRKQEMVQSWKTENFTLNKEILKVLRG
ncbi:MAG: cellulase family glycosylhydrolase [Candidatus Omnitrophica bacterium]|nr:cellulase family glycosylhydrolase [Candidatus Omnitrophota bacterium]